MKFGNICAICNFKRIFPTSSSKCFDFVTPVYTVLALHLYLSEELNKPMFVFCQFLSYCSFLFTGIQQ